MVICLERDANDLHMVQLGGSRDTDNRCSDNRCSDNRCSDNRYSDNRYSDNRAVGLGLISVFGDHQGKQLSASPPKVATLLFADNRCSDSCYSNKCYIG